MTRQRAEEIRKWLGIEDRFTKHTARHWAVALGTRPWRCKGAPTFSEMLTAFKVLDIPEVPHICETCAEWMNDNCRESTGPPRFYGCERWIWCDLEDDQQENNDANPTPDAAER